MKITIYAHPHSDPRTLANQVKIIIERDTGKPCIVNVTGENLNPSQFSNRE